MLCRVILRLPVEQDQRTPQLKVLDDHRPVAAGPDGRRRHGSEERAGCQHAAEHPVVVQPCRFGRRDLRREEGLTPRGVVAGTQERVATGGPATALAGHPVASVLEGVAGQRDSTSRLTSEQTLEGHRCARLVDPCSGLEEAAPCIPPVGPPAGRSLEARHRERLGGRPIRPAHEDHGPQHGVRADLHHHLHAELGQRLDRIPERNRRPRLPAPVRPVERHVRIDQPARHAAHQPARRRRDAKRGDDLLQVVEGGLDEGAVVGGTGRQHRRPEPFGLEARGDGADRIGRTADDLLGAVVGGNAEPRPGRCRVLFLQSGAHAVGGRIDGGHRPVRPQRPHQRPAFGCEPETVGEGENAGGLCGGDLAEAVSQNHVGPDSQARPQRRQGTLQGVDRRLRPGRVIQVSRLRSPEHDSEQRDASALPHLLVAAVQNAPHDRLAAVQRLAHADPLAGLTGVDERQLAPRRGSRLLRGAVAGFGRGKGLQGRAQRGGVAEGHAGAVREMAATGAGRPSHVGQQAFPGRTARRSGVLLEPSHVAAGKRPYRLRRPARQGQEPLGSRGGDLRCHGVPDGLGQRRGDGVRRTGGPACTARDTGRPVALHHHVRVRSRPAEAADAGQGWSLAVRRPRRRLGGHPHRQPIPVDLRARCLEVAVPRDHATVHRQSHLDEAGDPGRRLEMAQVRLDRPDQQRSPGRTIRPERVHHGPQLDRVADRCTRAVGLQVVDVGRRDARPAQRLGDDQFLRRAVRYRQPGARAVLVQRRTPDHGPDAVAVGLRLGESLEHHDPATLAAHVAVCRRVERGAATVGGQHPGVGAHFEQPPREDDVHPARQRQIRLAPLQSGHRLVHRNERRRAGRVEGDRRSLQTQRVGDPPDRRVERRAGDRVQAGRRLGGPGRLGHERPILVVADARVDAGAAALQPIRIDSGVLQGAPTGLQHQSLLRVQQVRLDRRDPEERRVELVDVVQEATEPAGRTLDPLVEQLPDAPGARAGDTLADRILPRLQQAPEGPQIAGAREPAGHADDRDRLLGQMPLPTPEAGFCDRILQVHPRSGGIVHSRCPSINFGRQHPRSSYGTLVHGPASGRGRSAR